MRTHANAALVHLLESRNGNRQLSGITYRLRLRGGVAERLRVLEGAVELSERRGNVDAALLHGESVHSRLADKRGMVDHVDAVCGD